MPNNQPVDQDALNLTHAIALAESGSNGKPNYNATGDAGTSKGAYQWQPGNFEAAAKSAGLDPTDFSPTNQDKVAYSEVKGYKDKGYDPGQIASLWNSGSPNNWQHHSGVATINGEKVPYDTPAYVQKVKQQYLPLRSQRSQGQQPAYPTQQLQIPAGVSTTSTPDSATGGNSFIGDASQTISNAGTGIGNAVQQGLSGKINPLSSALQVGGAVAGGITGLIGNTLEHLPVVGGVVKGAEGLIGQGIGALAQTSAGQQVAQGVQNFSQAHPELSGDIGATANIAGLVGGGLGGAAVKDVAESGLYNAAKEGVLGSGVKGLVEKSATKTATKILETSPTVNSVKAAIKGGRLAATKDGVSMAPDALKAASIKEITPLVKEGIVVPGKATANAVAIKNVADQTAVQMRDLLRNQEVQHLLQPEELQAMSQNVLKRAGEGLPTGENPAKSLLDVFYKALPQGGDITAEDVLNARQAVSRFVLDNRGDWSMRGVMTGFKTARDAIWDESRTLLANMAPNVPVRQLLEKQTNLYRALDYLPAAVKKELTTEQKGRIAQYFANHPIQAFAAKKAATGALVGMGIPYGEHLMQGL